jgi:hypothetical protein
MDSAVKITDVFVVISLERSQKPGEVHKGTLTGRRIQQDKTAAPENPETHYIQFIQNILGGYGAMLGAGSLADGWENLGGTSLSLAASHLGGGFGNEQRITLADTGDFILIRVRLPLGQYKIKLTFSAYIDNTKAGDSYFYLGVITRNDAYSALETLQSSELTLANGADGRQSYTVEFTPSALAVYIQGYVQGGTTGSAELGIDNAQLEIGELTDYVENDY